MGNVIFAYKTQIKALNVFLTTSDHHEHPKHLAAMVMVNGLHLYSAFLVLAAEQSTSHIHLFTSSRRLEEPGIEPTRSSSVALCVCVT